MKNPLASNTTRPALRHALVTALAFCALAAFSARVASAGGSAYFNHDINWQYTGDLYFSVAGGPANTCGDLWADRNDAGFTITSGWLCTDANGNSTKGPWSWANQASDETAFVYIRWPDGSSTNGGATHIWDKSAPTAAITSGGGAPPSSFSGTGSDTQYGACFNSNWTPSESFARFHDLTTDLYWIPGFTSYSVAAACRPGGGGCVYPYEDLTISGMPSCSISWSTSSVPPAGYHVSGHNYEWFVCVWDGGQWGCATEAFTY